MPITSRLYVFEESGAIKRVPKRIQDAMVFGEDAIPEYAGTRQRIATAIIENENGKPVRILDASGQFIPATEQQIAELEPIEYGETISLSSADVAAAGLSKTQQ